MKIIKLTKKQKADIESKVAEANRRRGDHPNGTHYSATDVIDCITKYASGIPVNDIAFKYKVEPHRIRRGFHHSTYRHLFPMLHKYNRIKQLNSYSPVGINAYYRNSL